MKVKEAVAIAHTLSKPSKMPCKGYAIPAIRCLTGSKLRKVKGSVCRVCYAMKGNYVFPDVKAALEKRYQSLTNPLWVEAMVTLISRSKNEFFRWHDSGDIQGLWHLEKIVEIAKRLPYIKFWLPTREYGMIQEYIEKGNVLPDNLIVRLSAFMVDGPAPEALAKRLKVVVSGVSDQSSYTCPASNQDNECRDCRACWNKETFCVSYRKH